MHKTRVSRRAEASNPRDYPARETDDARNLKLFADMAYVVPESGQGTLDFTPTPEGQARARDLLIETLTGGGQ